MANLKDFENWVDELTSAKFGDMNKIHYYDSEVNESGEYGNLKIKIYTLLHVYHIIALCSADGKNYLGCTMSNRRANPGENHTRGSDLPDGPLSKETWFNIIYSILNLELE